MLTFYIETINSLANADLMATRLNFLPFFDVAYFQRICVSARSSRALFISHRHDTGDEKLPTTMFRALTRLREKIIGRSPFVHSDNVTEVDKCTAAANIEFHAVGHNTLKVFENVKLQATRMTEWCWPPRHVREIEMSKPKIPISSKVIFEECVS